MIVNEAYNLLKIQFSKEENGFADMDTYIGTVREHEDKYWNNISIVTGGSDHEDRADIVFGHTGLFVSNTHFWDIDNIGDNNINLKFNFLGNKTVILR